MKKHLLLFSLLGVVSSSATVITFQAGVNSYDHLAFDIRSGPTAGTNNGQEILFGYQAGSTAVNSIRSLFSYSLSTLPAGAIINSISLTLTATGTQTGSFTGLGAVNMHEVIPNGIAANDFVESQTNWANWKTGTAWTAPGGDYSSTVLSTATYNNVASTTRITAGETAVFSSSAAFVAAAQNAFNAGLPLEFILIAPTTEANLTSNYFRFVSEDFTGGTDTRPLLTIDYTIPEPSTAALAGLAGAIVFLRRRR